MKEMLTSRVENWVVMPVLACRHTAVEAAKSALAQDVPTKLLVISNWATDGSREAITALQATDKRVHMINFSGRQSLAAVWNTGLRLLFSNGAEHVCVINDDVLLRQDHYRVCRDDPHGLVTGVGVDERGWKKAKDAPLNLTFNTHPTFSAFMLKKWAWDKVGEFDENFKVAVTEDCDYHIRMHRAGIKAICLNVPFLHYGSATSNSMTAEDRQIFMEQADKNREYFFQKWGVRVASKEYYDQFGHGHPPDKSYE